MAFLFRQMGTFNMAKMQDLTNLNSDGPTVCELAAAPFRCCRSRARRTRCSLLPPSAARASCCRTRECKDVASA